MDHHVTLSLKGILVAAVVALALVVAYLLGSGGGSARADTTGPSADPAGAAKPRTLVMTGTGSTSAYRTRSRSRSPSAWSGPRCRPRWPTRTPP